MKSRSEGLPSGHNDSRGALLLSFSTRALLLIHSSVTPLSPQTQIQETEFKVRSIVINSKNGSASWSEQSNMYVKEHWDKQRSKGQVGMWQKQVASLQGPRGLNMSVQEKYLKLLIGLRWPLPVVATFYTPLSSHWGWVVFGSHLCCIRHRLLLCHVLVYNRGAVLFSLVQMESFPFSTNCAGPTTTDLSDLLNGSFLLCLMQTAN